jgi:uncharacterized membrane protein
MASGIRLPHRAFATNWVSIWLIRTAGEENLMSQDRTSKFARAAENFLGKHPAQLTERERTIIEQAISRRTLSRDPAAEFNERLTLGQKLADNVATFGGSWGFIIGFGIVLVVWVLSNLLLASRAFDPYPFIFLNLMLSMLAAVQAPVIMMSQNRQAAKDRDVSAHDYEVNLKAEIEIMALHDKFDRLREEEIRQIVLRQQEQIERLTRLVENHLGAKPAGTESQ